MDIIKRFLTAIAGSKKAVAAIATVVFVLLKPVLARLGLEVTETELQVTVAIALVWLASQGLNDIGKGAKQVELLTATPAAVLAMLLKMSPEDRSTLMKIAEEPRVFPLPAPAAKTTSGTIEVG